MASSDHGVRGTRPVRIGNCSGFYGDRMSAIREIVDGGPVDVIVGDYLAEITMLILAKAKLKDPAAGYATTFLRQLDPVLEDIADKGIKIVVNAGGLNPGGLAKATSDLIRERGLELKVSYVEGDDILSRLPELQEAGHDIAHLLDGKPLSSWTYEPLTANAYLGGHGIAEALRNGADIVITGRTADASLVVGVSEWWWDWTPTDYDQLAGAVAAGHIIECSSQATGGNFSGFGEIPELEYPGFPIAYVDRDGSSVITKHPGTGGAVTTDTVTAQLLYEIGAPAYLNSDVTTHLDSIELDQLSADRVRISGVRGSAPPDTTKVSITAIGGWHNSAVFLVTGLNIDEKIDLITRTVKQKLTGLRGIESIRIDRIGQVAEDPPDQLSGTCALRVAVHGDEQSAGRAFSAALVEMALASYPGHYQLHPPSRGSSYGVYWPGLVPQDVLQHRVTHHDGTVADMPSVPAVPVTEIPAAPSPATTAPPTHGETSRVPLGAFANARSGDKGGDANVGVWVSSDEHYDWLRSSLDVDLIRQLLPEAAELDIDRYELANLRAVNFVIHGLLGEGATSTLRLDNQAKALGEWLLSRSVDVPAGLLVR